MLKVRRVVRPEEVRQGAEYRLFVEGSGQEAIDPMILRTLLKNKIRIEPLGPSSHIKSTAKALHKYHPNYYFLIDRDHYSDDDVNKCWANFPNPEKSNLLIWRRREIENYFLEPDYLLKSEYISVSEDQLRKKILQYSNERLYFDISNQVIISIREEQKETWIKLFENPDDFKSRDAALAKLTENTRFIKREKNIAKTVEKSTIKKKFEDFLKKATNGKEPLEYECGNWIGLLKGKKILGRILHECFKVKDAQNNILQGKVKEKEILKELVKKTLNEQPKDFQELYKLINENIREKKLFS